MTNNYGPKLKISDEIHAMKYRLKGETFKDSMVRVADALKDNEDHYKALKSILLEQRFLPAGRVQAAMGAPRVVTAYNCFVSSTIPDSMDGIMKAATEAAETMRLGGGIGYDFSTLRPRGDHIRSLDSKSSGPISFMGIFDSLCKTIASAGHRRGAQMGVLRVDHPDIEEFVKAKTNTTNLTQFNISVGITDKFMEAVEKDTMFDLVFDGRVHKTIRAKALWDDIMRATWDWAEPGILFIDRMNQKNNLWYCETIAATNPCLHPDSIIETVHGRVKIKDITEPTYVYTMQSDGSLGIRKSSASWVSKQNATTIKITVGSGKSVTCTPDHKIMVVGKGWVEAGSLAIGDKLVHLCRSRRGAAYSGVKLSTEENRAYQMEHRLIWEGVHGKIPEDYDIHHVNGDSYDNYLDNFECISHSEHSTLTRYQCANDHMRNGLNEKGKWRFLKGDKKPKTIIPMPEELRSSMKNSSSACVVSIEEGPVTDVYDLTVEDTHNFISDFIVVHNCGEQPLPPYGACLLGSFNLTKYIDFKGELPFFDFALFREDIPHVVRAMDNVIDRTYYPLPEQEKEAKSKRRMGLGLTGVANAIEVLGAKYGTDDFCEILEQIMTVLRDEAYAASIGLAMEKGAFPMFRTDVLDSAFAKTLPENLRHLIYSVGIRNSHLLSIAPTGTISLSADNVSSGIEPVFSLWYDRTIQTFEGPKVERVEDYGFRVFGVSGATANSLSVFDHVKVLNVASKYVDSACSKTCNVGPDVSWEDFKRVYWEAYKGGASGCTTFRSAGKRYGILNANAAEEVAEEHTEEPDTFVNETEGSACYFDPQTGQRTCS